MIHFYLLTNNLSYDSIRVYYQFFIIYYNYMKARKLHSNNKAPISMGAMNLFFPADKREVDLFLYTYREELRKVLKPIPYYNFNKKS